MEIILNWIKKHKKCSLLIIVGLFILPIISVHLLFKWKTEIGFIQAEWEAGDILAYIGGFYSFAGTVIFSLLTLWQNYIINKKNDEYNHKILAIETELNMPIFDIPYVDGSGQGCNGEYINYSLNLRNISPNPAINLCVGNFSVFDDTGRKIATSNSVKISDSVLFTQSSISVNFKNNEFDGENLTIEFSFECKDKYYNKHYFLAKGHINNAKKFEAIVFDLCEQKSKVT